jgi:hypothetical protein
VLNCVACSLLIHTFVSDAGHAAVRHCAWLDKYIAMRLFQSLEISPSAPREYSHRRMSRGQAVSGIRAGKRKKFKYSLSGVAGGRELVLDEGPDDGQQPGAVGSGARAAVQAGHQRRGQARRHVLLAEQQAQRHQVWRVP